MVIKENISVFWNARNSGLLSVPTNTPTNLLYFKCNQCGIPKQHQALFMSCITREHSLKRGCIPQLVVGWETNNQWRNRIKMSSFFFIKLWLLRLYDTNGVPMSLWSVYIQLFYLLHMVKQLTYLTSFSLHWRFPKVVPMGAIVIRTRYDEGTESTEVATSAMYACLQGYRK
jgi:hypothetical protein